MKVGDLVRLRKGEYNFTATGQPKWVWTEVLGVITDNRGFVDVVIDPLPKSVKESSEDETECGQESRQIQ